MNILLKTSVSSLTAKDVETVVEGTEGKNKELHVPEVEHIFAFLETLGPATLQTSEAHACPLACREKNLRGSESPFPLVDAHQQGCLLPFVCCSFALDTIQLSGGALVFGLATPLSLVFPPPNIMISCRNTTDDSFQTVMWQHTIPVPPPTSLLS